MYCRGMRRWVDGWWLIVVSFGIFMASFKDLEVWQESIALIKETYSLTEQFPEKERFRLVDQTCRAVSSIPANIAEGSARKSTKDFMRFIAMALGSLAELRTHFIIAKELGYLKELESIEGRCDVLGRKMQSLYRALDRKK